MSNKYLLGFDIGTSSVKAALVDAATGQALASDFYPKREAPIIARQAGWAEQEPEMWWENLVEATRLVLAKAGADGRQVEAIGLSYQMHGLVCVGRDGRALRPSIIWCDSRALPYGQEAFDAIGHERCLSRLLNSPGNFTAAKLAWVKRNEPELYHNIYKVMLPGDYIALRLSGQMTTTVSGLSEGMFWDFEQNRVSDDIMQHFGFAPSLIPDLVPNLGRQSTLSPEAAQLLGLTAGTPIAYRGGDQPNNALSLGVMRAGEVAATGGTSGVVYGVIDRVGYDPQSRVNTFAHVNHTAAAPRLGVLLCINGTGILNAYMRRTVAPEGISYAEMNELAAQAPIGADGLTVIPFGNGAERLLSGRNPGASIHGLNFNRHQRAHLLRAAQEGIAYSFVYGMDIMRRMGLNLSTIKAPRANLFLSPLFLEALSTTSGATIQLYDTDGAAGAAQGAGIGAGLYASADEALRRLRLLQTITPNAEHTAQYREAYARWESNL